MGALAPPLNNTQKKQMSVVVTWGPLVYFSLLPHQPKICSMVHGYTKIFYKQFQLELSTQNCLSRG